MQHATGHKRAKTINICFAALLFAQACVSAPPHAQKSPAEAREQAENIDRELRIALLKELKVQTGPNAKSAAAYFTRVARSLAANDKRFVGARLSVSLVEEKDGAWADFALPDGQIYLSLDLVRRLEFENEVAAAIALQLSHLAAGDALARAREAEENGSLAPDAVFAFDNPQMLAAIDGGVGLLHEAGYDPRGMTSLWERYAAPGIRSRYASSQAAAFVEHSRATVALYSPLRNPIVRSHAFLEVRKRIMAP